MEILKSVEEFSLWRKNIIQTIGFVPTMGALHKGHLSLVQKSKDCCDITVVSIFINPTQFSAHEDLSSYPQTLDLDIRCLEKLDINILFLPNHDEMYNKVQGVRVPTSDLFTKLEGAARPHFFFGVTQIVAKLFNVIKPTHAFFGEKDAQQLIVINQMIDVMNYNIKLISCPTVRDKNGLALSSRNQYLSKKDQADAAFFYACFSKMKNTLERGENSSLVLKQVFQKELLMSDKFKLDYISIASKKTLNEIDLIHGEVLISAAVFFNDVRLIDNFTYQFST